MRLVLLSGGGGKRLWPLSNQTRSKQFLKLIQGTDGKLESTIQRMIRLIKKSALLDKTFVSIGKKQVDIIQNQIVDSIPLIIEPERRDTFPAIALSCSYLYSKEKVNPNEIICILPVDHYVEEDFFEILKLLENTLLNSGASIGLIGIEPTSPSTEYGYILADISSGGKSPSPIKKFIEKPNKKIAERLLEEKALWNSGIFGFKLGYILSILEDRKWPLAYDDLLEKYSMMPKISFDYEVLERETNVVVLPYSGYWIDLGNWNTLTKHLSNNVLGKGIMAEDCNNSYLINETNMPVLMTGVANIVVAVSSDGILVLDKKQSQNHLFKELVKQVEQRPMFEEKRWGWYKVIDYIQINNGAQVLTKRIKIFAGKNISYQMHEERSEVWTIISGEGVFALNDQIWNVKSGDALTIPRGAKHGIKATTDLEFIEVQMGSSLIEEDITRIYLEWEDVEKNGYPK